jgi:hypothetical protein
MLSGVIGKGRADPKEKWRGKHAFDWKCFGK